MNYYYAPMEGLTDSVYRREHHRFFGGVDRYYMPFFSPTVHRALTVREARELTKAEYLRLVQAAREKGNLRLELLLETICATGIRVGEVKYITVEAAQTGAAEIALKGKIRTILLPNRLCRKLLRYAKKQKITSGKIFLTRGGMGCPESISGLK